MPSLGQMKRLAPLLLMLALSPPAGAVVLMIDYSYDTANFFSTNTVAKAAVEAAALDLGNAITSSLGAVTTNVYASTNGSTTATFDWSLNFTNPTTGGAESVGMFNVPANQITIYAGMRPLTGTTLGVGGPAGGGISAGVSGFENELVNAVAGAESASNAAMSRGAGPVIGTLADSLTLGSTTANYSLNYGTILGSLSFDSDSDNSGGADDVTTLATYWHYDHTTAVDAGKNDLYSVALHEMLHAIGVGASATWDSLKSGTDWTGANVIALNGTGTGLISSGGDHIADGAMSFRISDGMAQEAVMDPTITVGTRKSLTALDLAFLQDLGFTTVAVPEPSRMLLLLLGVNGVLLIRRRRELR